MDSINQKIEKKIRTLDEINQYTIKSINKIKVDKKDNEKKGKQKIIPSLPKRNFDKVYSDFNGNRNDSNKTLLHNREKRVFDKSKYNT